MKIIGPIVLAILPCILFSCKKSTKNHASSTKSDSAFADIYDGEISDGIVRVPINTQAEKFQEYVREQLKYLEGQFIYIDVGIKLPSMKIDILSSSVGGQFLEVKYKAAGIVTLPRTGMYEEYAKKLFDTSKALAGVVPAMPSEKDPFYNAFNKTCSIESSIPDKFWYYFKPAVEGNKTPGDSTSPFIRTCPLYETLAKMDATSSVSEVNNVPITKLILRITPSSTKTDGKKPEYAKIFEHDNSLEATIVIGSNGGDRSSDSGYLTYEATINGLSSYFGPSKINRLDLAGENRYEIISKNLFITQLYEKNSKTVKLNLFLIDDLTQSNLEQPYVEAAARSDLVIYTGHSGLGKNINKLSQMTKFNKGKYTIFFSNGCSTLSYLSDTLSAKVAQLNPGENSTKYLDIIVNSLPSPDNVGGQTHVAWITSLFEGQATFKQILTKIDSEAQASVWGEEDNPAF